MPTVSKNEPPQHLHLLEAGCDGLHLIYELEPANDEMPATYLGQHFIVIALDDFRASYMLNGRWQEVDYAQGEIAIFPATELFPRSKSDREVPLLELFVEPAMLARVASESVDVDQIELVPQWKLCDPLIQHLGLALKAELEAGNTGCRLYLESMVTALSAHLVRRYSSQQQQIINYTGGLPKYKLREVLGYIHGNLDRDLNLAELSGIVHMSPHYFASLFKQSTGLSPHQYVMKCRIDRAKQLLLKQDLTLVEICQQVGFQNQSHFTRVFRQLTKTTPKAYRKMF
ncbi:MAG: helix-turn-helix transcriptional regulator [Chlorogloeopsis fritschii C42_A2020_084]|uniref:helix-turn-helix domain-containing protein n=1 Tax=Chlorogloeopsis fritschii TaxID=1124 RepID=UPI0019E79F5D|nr:AraC family transcriptional regulator [Chlorogloeopsis fritschii]MBF2008617.1 helix-turn-helix transcriptional regulator [Chlorogloeopsis fritschii C42_A2020_084]